MLWNGGSSITFAENDIRRSSGNIQTVAETTTSMQANHTAWLSLDFFPLFSDEEDTEITVPNKEGTRNTVWLCNCTSPAARTLLGRVSILARPIDVCVLPVVLDSRADDACVASRVRPSTTVTFAGHKNTDCRGHDLHDLRKDCSIALDSYRTPQVCGLAGRIMRGAGGRCRRWGPINSTGASAGLRMRVIVHRNMEGRVTGGT